MSAAPRTRTTKPATPTKPLVTDAEYKELLAIRLEAMHGFEDGTVDAETKNRARAAVRNARKVRKDPDQLALNDAWNAFQQAQAEAKQAAAEARKSARKPRAKKSAEPETEAPVQELEDGEQDTVPEVAETE